MNLVIAKFLSFRGWQELDYLTNTDQVIPDWLVLHYISRRAKTLSLGLVTMRLSINDSILGLTLLLLFFNTTCLLYLYMLHTGVGWYSQAYWKKLFLMTYYPGDFCTLQISLPQNSKALLHFLSTASVYCITWQVYNSRQMCNRSGLQELLTQKPVHKSSSSTGQKTEETFHQSR